MADTKSPQSNTAAFYDVDGTLIKTNVVHAYAYYAVNAPSLTDRFARTAGLLASLPFYWAADKYDRKLFNDTFYKNYAGFGEDRLIVLGQEVFDKVIRPNIFEGARSLMERSRAEGHRQILITGAIDYVTKPLADFLGVEEFVANRLEIIDGVATGRVVQPMVAGPSKAIWVRKFAKEHDLDLERCFAYADSGSDVPLLSAVGNPCAVNPDRQLKTTAKAYQWPVLNLN